MVGTLAAASPADDPDVRPASGSGGRPFRLRHLSALDGLRGVAVAGVVLFHTNLLTGGYLGVDLFFVLSGFLITTLLLEERLRTGGVALKAFWIRRARRLLPALIGLVAAVALYVWFLADPTELSRLRGDLLGTAGYVANWHAILAKQGYWDLFNAPSLLQHTWSLAIEEQFYLVWPALLGGLLWWRNGSVRAVFATTVAFALAGGLWLIVAYDPADPSRVYYGTDTRMPALLLGAAFAAWLQWRGTTRSHTARVTIEAVALVASGLLLVAWIFLDGGNAFLYRGGLFLCGVAVVAILASITHPVKGPLARALGWMPLRFLGLISYGLYLWHWPVIVILNKSRTHLDGLVLVAVQVMVSVVLATISFVVLERPIRRNGLAAWRWRPLAPLAGVGLLVLTLGIASLGATDTADAKAAADQAVVPLGQQRGEPVAVQFPDRVKAGQPLPRPTDRLPRLLVVGDSVGHSLGTDLTTKASDWQVQTADRAIPGCGFDRGTGRTKTPTGQVRQEEPACQQWPSLWAADVDAFRPDAVLFVFGGIHTDPREIGGAFHGPCDNEYKQWVRAELDDAFRLLSAKGAVVYAAPIAYSRYAYTSPNIDEITDCFNPVLRAAAAANPSVRVLPIDTWVCPSRTTCRETAPDGTKLRYDGLHYRDAGADAADRWILDQVFEASTPGASVAGSAPSPVDLPALVTTSTTATTTPAPTTSTRPRAR